MIATPVSAHSRFNTPLAVSIFANKTQTTAIKAVAKPWSKIVELHQKLSVREAKDGLMVGGYRLNGSRSNANVTVRSFIQLDIDSEVTKDKSTREIVEVISAPTIEQLRPKIEKYEWFAHSTHSHNPAHGIIKIRVVILPDRDILPDEYPLVLEALDELLGGVLDRAAWPLSQAFYLPSATESNENEAFFLHPKGIPLPVDEYVTRGREILDQKPSFKPVPSSNNAPLLVSNLAEPETDNNIARLAAALHMITPDTHYEEWRDVCWSVLATGWECAAKLAQEWSAGGKKYDAKTFDVVVRDFNPQSGIGTGTLYHIAKKYGLQNAVITEPEWLTEMNGEYAWIEKEAKIYRIELGSFIAVHDFRNQFANRFVNKQVGDNVKQASLGQEWMISPQRRQHKALVMRPGQDPVTKENSLNTWRGFETRPVAGDARPFFKLLTRLVPETRAATYIIHWLAHLLQHPGEKMHTALVMWSHKQGVGKNLLFECLIKVIGNYHSTLISQADLARDFNGWTKNKILVIGDEVSGADRREQQDKLKGYITGTTVQVNEKHQPAYEVENLMNFVFLSNRSDAIFLDDNDRRYFVWEVEADKLPRNEAIEFVRWRDNGGLAALLDKLCNISLAAFDPKAPAPQTEAKSEMVADSQSDFENWAQSTMSDGAQSEIAKELVTSAELKAAYEATGRGKVSTKTVATTFKKLGAFAFKGQVRLASKQKFRLMAIVSINYWRRQPEAAWAGEFQLSSVTSSWGPSFRLTSASRRASD